MPRPHSTLYPKSNETRTGQAVVRLNGRDYSLGRYGSAEAGGVRYPDFAMGRERAARA
jgi:hypothetical protein